MVSVNSGMDTTNTVGRACARFLMIYLLGVKPRKLWMNAICGDVIKIGQVTNSAKSVLLLIDLEISTNNVCMIHVNPAKKKLRTRLRANNLKINR